MIEDEGKALPVGKDGVTVTVGRHAIETVKLIPGKTLF